MNKLTGDHGLNLSDLKKKDSKFIPLEVIPFGVIVQTSKQIGQLLNCTNTYTDLNL